MTEEKLVVYTFEGIYNFDTIEEAEQWRIKRKGSIIIRIKYLFYKIRKYRSRIKRYIKGESVWH